MRFIRLCFFACLCLAACPAWADCSDPSAPEGRLVYNSMYKVAQFCDGTNWISMAGGSTVDARIGTLAAGKWCASDGGTINCTLDAPVTVAGSNMQVIFNDGGAALAGAAQLFWDKAGNRLGVGTASPLRRLHVSGAMEITASNGQFLYFSSPGAPEGARNWAIFDNNTSGRLAIKPRNDDYSNPSDTRAVFIEHTTGNVGLGVGSPAAKLDVAGEVRTERLRARDCSQLVKTVAARDYITLNAQLDADFSTASICGAGWHVCNAQEAGIYGIVYGCEMPADGAWIIGGFPNMEAHRRSLWNGQDLAMCEAGKYPIWYWTYQTYKGRVHCQIETQVRPVACCRLP